MAADIIDLRPILARELPDAEFAKREADRALHYAIRDYKTIHGEAIALARLKQIVAGIEYFMQWEAEQ